MFHLTHLIRTGGTFTTLPLSELFFSLGFAKFPSKERAGPAYELIEQRVGDRGLDTTCPSSIRNSDLTVLTAHSLPSVMYFALMKIATVLLVFLGDACQRALSL
mmetsp:Transcript_8922/g.15707  ORF Transcript_8922/g.15707 Transcript_8922/m.15707 type:complete len:104 (-) Transcript_8922:14-325(-)